MKQYTLMISTQISKIWEIWVLGKLWIWLAMEILMNWRNKMELSKLRIWPKKICESVTQFTITLMIRLSIKNFDTFCFFPLYGISLFCILLALQDPEALGMHERRLSDLKRRNDHKNSLNKKSTIYDMRCDRSARNEIHSSLDIAHLPVAVSLYLIHWLHKSHNLFFSFTVLSLIEDVNLPPYYIEHPPTLLNQFPC